jgi:hypothetical protein
MQNHMAMRIGVLLGLVLPFAGASAQGTYGVGVKPFQTYNQVRKALLGGQRLSVVLNFNTCDPKGPPDHHGGIPIQDFMVLSDHIAFSSLHQTVDASNNIVYEFNRYKISPLTQAPSSAAHVELSTYSWKAGETPQPVANYACDTDGGGADISG